MTVAIGSSLRKIFAKKDAIEPVEWTYHCTRRKPIISLHIESNTNCAPCGSSDADNNSEINVSIRHLSVESRGNSLESQVSQISMKMSEASIVSRSKNRRRILGEKKRRRFYLNGKNRRASSSSIESQRITNQMKNFKYKYKSPNARFRVAENMLRQQIDRYGPCEMTETNNLHESEDEQSNDDSKPPQDTIETSETAIISMQNPRLTAYSSESSIDELHDKQMLPSQMCKNSADNQLDSAHYQPYLPNKVGDGLMSSNVLCNRNMMTSATNSGRIKMEPQFNKSGCNVGIPDNVQRISYDVDYTEMHQLLPARKRDVPSIIRADNLSGKHLSESEKMEKLKKLLLPSK